MKLVAPCPPAQIDEGSAAAIEHVDRPFAETAPSCLIQGPGAVKKIAVPHRYRALCLFEITNFVILRRHLGREEAERLIPSFIRVIADQSPDIRLTATGRATAELSFECDDPEHASRTVDLLRSCLPLMGVGGGSYPVSTRFGLAVAPGRNCDELRLIEAAEAALDEARSQDPIVVRDLSCAELAFDRLAMMRELPRAIARGEMFIHYQPKVHVRRQKVASAEALLRWHHPTHGLIAPGDFIGVAEEAGEIGALTLWTMRRVIEDQKRLAAAGHDIPLFLNISGMLLADAAFVAEACEIVSGSDAKLGFEITETAVIRDPESAIRHLQNFARIGVQLAIDDYGAGLSSLAYLKQLPARELKIDKMFVLQLTSSNRDPLIVRSTIDLAHALEMEVTAEGVETPSALALLSVMGCDMVQGFLISRPVALDALLTFLHEDAHLTSGVGGLSPFARPESFWKRA
ncbi:EAL domain-containing protein [Sphingomonas sp. IC-56]|uniref:EAL domain-containing protein n=1 Tax=Sphingomonas sp. IC-56 TaxID=2898529 RepID=UPI001E334E84|nr:EAL domain-containing protein [Sphingomonas sp. IC-56]MCD2322505.1 EAL domain-containing protein [Sphingomonas sp. IC-56]